VINLSRKTAGKGYKGQRARAGGGVSHRYEGGQAGFHRRMPKFGCPRRYFFDKTANIFS